MNNVYRGICAQRLSDRVAADDAFGLAATLARQCGAIPVEAEARIRKALIDSNANPICIDEIRSAFDLYFSVADPNDRALEGLRAMAGALTSANREAVDRLVASARSHWTAVGRHDLVWLWIDFLEPADSQGTAAGR